MITIKFCGHNSHHTSLFEMEHKDGLSNYLLLLVKTEAWFYLNGTLTQTKPNMVILFDRNTYIHYGCNEPIYNDDWVHFNMDKKDEEDLFSILQIPLNQPFYLPHIHVLSHYIQLLANTFHSRSPHCGLISDSLMRTLLYTLDEELHKFPDSNIEHKHYSSFISLRTQLYTNPSEQWSGNNMANSLCLSTSYFQHLYKQFFGCSCQQDIIRARLEQAKFYLCSSDMPINRLADFCGYENELHFMRQFKKFEGMTPSQYRQNNKK
ncbi:helix-turn-helix transcriptional regulator [Anaerosporobacter sp.]|uniref:helix-turn-helix transcriptional regulator n=1 Tax=Anaerosporobacter sp. TaxID=1872529 RepID=UPI00286F0DA1|nr:AraC family transcriptional regulator [Anaerosporobacter sp.]